MLTWIADHVSMLLFLLLLRFHRHYSPSCGIYIQWNLRFLLQVFFDLSMFVPLTSLPRVFIRFLQLVALFLYSFVKHLYAWMLVIFNVTDFGQFFEYCFVPRYRDTGFARRCLLVKQDYAGSQSWWPAGCKRNEFSPTSFHHVAGPAVPSTGIIVFIFPERKSYFGIQGCIS